MKKVTIITIIDSHSERQQSLILNSNLLVAGYEYDLFIAVNGSHAPEALNMDFLKPTECWCFPMEYSKSELLNKMLKNVSTSLVCILNNNAYLDPNWLTEMVAYNSMIERSGIGIIDADKKGYYTNLMTISGDLEFLAVPAVDGVKGCMLFDQSLVSSLGAFNEGLHSNWQYADYAERANRCGFNNYFVPSKNAVPVYTDELEPWVSTEQQYKDIRKKLPIFIQLSDFDPAVEIAFGKADDLVEKIKSSLLKIVNEFMINVELVENRNGNSFYIRVPVVTSAETDLISSFAADNKLNWFVRSDDNKLLIVFTNKNQ